MSWTGEYWGKNGAVAKAEQRFDSKKDAGSCIEYASVCYAAANRIFSDILHLRRSGLRRWKQGIHLSKLAVCLCDKIPINTIKYSVDLNNRASMIDIVCSIYSRYGFLCGNRRDKIYFQIVPEIQEILRNCSLRTSSDEYVAPHTQVFLLLHQLKANYKVLKISDPVFERISMLLTETKKGDLAQASRIARQLSKILVGRRQRKRYYAFAVKWAKEANATDQLAKL